MRIIRPRGRASHHLACMSRVAWSILVVALASSCSILTVSRAPRAEDHRYARRVVRDHPHLRTLGDHHRISWQGWEGDSIAVMPEAVDRTVIIGPPLLPLFPFTTGYGGMGDGAYGAEVSSPDRFWVAVLLTIAPGHSIVLDPCAAEWVGGRDTLRGAGMVRTDGTLASAAFIPLAYRCNAPPGPMTWMNPGGEPQPVHLMLRFQPGIHLKGGARWTLRLPCIVNGVPRTAEYTYRYGQWMHYVPIALVNG